MTSFYLVMNLAAVGEPPSSIGCDDAGDHALARKLWDYDPDSGELRWRFKTHGNVVLGAVAGWPVTGGYLAVNFRRRPIKMHRVVWLWCYGTWPKHQLDHINGIRGDNRISNLREVTCAQNQQNRSHRGTSFRPHRGNWGAEIKLNGRKIFIGAFSTEQEAHEAYVSAKKKLHPFWNGKTRAHPDLLASLPVPVGPPNPPNPSTGD